MHKSCLNCYKLNTCSIIDNTIFDYVNNKEIFKIKYYELVAGYCDHYENEVVHKISTGIYK